MQSNLTLPPPPPTPRITAIARGFAWMLLLALLAGCKSLPITPDTVIGPSYQVQNIYQSVFWIPSEVRRVAVLPLTCGPDSSQMADGAEMLWPVLLDELGKTRRFEIKIVTSEKLRAWTGRNQWLAEEPIPPRLMEYLRGELGCDAVLFSRLTRFHAYPPQVQGYNIKLVRFNESSKNLDILWAVDEVLDTGDETVVNGARRYAKATMHGPKSLSDSRFILNSPTRFGHYALAAILETMPER